MKVAVSTITKDEAQHLPQWAASAQDADLMLIGDTGSQDATVEVARELGVEVVEMAVLPWRFDNARNTLLSMTPRDIDVVITVDADEELAPGWREQLEQAAAEHPEARRFSYTYVWNWVEGQIGVEPDVMFTADRCYSRTGWRWYGTVHETLRPAGTDPVGPTVWAGFRVEHYADNSKSRSNYLPLLELAVAEEPHDPRQRFYLGREYCFQGQWDASRRTLVEFLAMPEATWDAERAEAYRLIAQMDDDPERWLLKAVAEAPGRRDAVVDLLDLYERQGRTAEAAGMAARALRVVQRPGDYMSRARTWDDTRLRRIVDRG